MLYLVVRTSYFCSEGELRATQEAMEGEQREAVEGELRATQEAMDREPPAPTAKKVCTTQACELHQPELAIVCARPAGELLPAPHQTSPSAEMVCARLLDGLLPTPDQPSVDVLCARPAVAKERSLTAEERVKGLLKEMSAALPPPESSS